MEPCLHINAYVYFFKVDLSLKVDLYHGWNINLDFQKKKILTETHSMIFSIYLLFAARSESVKSISHAQKPYH